MTNKPSLIIPPADPVEQDNDPRGVRRAKQPYNCTMCRHFDPAPEVQAQHGVEGFCIAHPPLVEFIGMKPHPISHQMEPVTHQFVPQVSKYFVCGEFSPRDVQ